MNYNTFISKYGEYLLENINENEYLILRSYITNEVNNVIRYNNLKNINTDICVYSIMYYLLKEKTYTDIMNNGYEDVIYNGVIRYSKRVNNKEDNKALNYIKSCLLEIKDIFSKDTSLDILSIDIYSALKNRGYTDQMILEEMCDNKIVEILQNKKYNDEINFSSEFNDLNDTIEETVNDIYNIMTLQNEYQIYDSEKYKNKLSFISSVVFFNEGVTSDEVNYDRLYSIVENDMKRNIIKNKSVKQDNTPYYSARYNNSKTDDEIKKKLIIGTLVAIFILENLTYKIIDIYKDKKEAKAREEYAASQVVTYPEGTIGNILKAWDKNKEIERGNALGK